MLPNCLEYAEVHLPFPEILKVSDTMSEGTKARAVDLNGASAGHIEPMPEQNNIDEIAAEAGIEVPEEEPLHIKETLEQHDQQR